MLKRLLNETTFFLTITAVDPMLVKTGSVALSGPDMQWLQTMNVEGQMVQVIPGTTLKGAFRSYVEKILRTLSQHVCDPFNHENGKSDRFCGDQWKNLKHSPPMTEAYTMSCPACRLFGSTQFMGRLATADAVPAKRLPTEKRDGVGIDRHSGGAYPGAKFDFEVVPAGSEFKTKISIRNFELWQLGLFLLALRDFTQGFIRIGSAKSRGLGGISAKITGWEIDVIDIRKPGAKLTGIGSRMSAGDVKTYGIVANPDEIQLPEALAGAWSSDGLRWRLKPPADHVEPLMQLIAGVFTKAVENNALPKTN